MVELFSDSLYGAIKVLNTAATVDRAEDAVERDTTADPLKRKVTENPNLLNLIIRANDMKKELLKAMTKSTPDELYEILVDVGNFPINEGAINNLNSVDWHIPLAGEQTPRTVSSQITENITDSLGTQVVDFHTGAQLRVNTVRGFANQPCTMQGSFQTHEGRHLPLRRLSLEDEDAIKLLLQLAEQRLCASIIKSALDGEDTINSCMVKMRELIEKMSLNPTEDR